MVPTVTGKPAVIAGPLSPALRQAVGVVMAGSAMSFQDSTIVNVAAAEATAWIAGLFAAERHSRFARPNQHGQGGRASHAPDRRTSSVPGTAGMPREARP
jgi:hypothetical protein